MKVVLDSILPANAHKQLEGFFFDSLPSPIGSAHHKLFESAQEHHINPLIVPFYPAEVVNLLRLHWLKSKPEAIPPFVPFRNINVEATTITMPPDNNPKILEVPQMTVDQFDNVISIVVHVANVTERSIGLEAINECEVRSLHPDDFYVVIM